MAPPAPNKPASQQPRPRRPFQFTIFGMLLLMTVACMSAFLYAGLFNKQNPEEDVNFGFVIAAAAVPMAVMFAAASISAVLTWNAKRKRKKKPVEDDEPF